MALAYMSGIFERAVAPFKTDHTKAGKKFFDAQY